MRSESSGGLAAIAGAAIGLSALTTVPAAAAEVTNTIADVQGTGAATPLNGTVVTVEGIITGDYRNASGSGYRGFYLQTPDSASPDFTPGASDGIFLFSANSNPAVALGDLVRVTGTAQEFNGQTQLAATTDAGLRTRDAGRRLACAGGAAGQRDRLGCARPTRACSSCRRPRTSARPTRTRASGRSGSTSERPR